MLKSFLRKNRLSNNSLIIYYNYRVNNNDDDKIQLFWVCRFHYLLILPAVKTTSYVLRSLRSEGASR